MSRLEVTLAVGAAIALFGWAAPAQASPEPAAASSVRQGVREMTAPGGGGLPPLAVKVDLAGGVVWFRSCPDATPTCKTDDTSPALPITLDRAALPSERDIALDAVPIGQGKHAVHVRVPSSRSSVAWEAVLVAGARAPVFVGLTGYVRGDPGDRTGTMVDIVRSEDGDPKVLVADIREDLRICGQARTPLAPRVLDANTLTLFGATMQRLSPEQRRKAERLVAAPKKTADAPPLARLLRAIGSSVPNDSGAALTDGDPATAWSEQRPGDGHGEFVVMTKPPEVPLARLALRFAPAKNARPSGAAPSTFYLVSDTKTYAVSVPEDAWGRPGQIYEVSFAEPVRGGCLTFVLDQAYARNARPEVTVAEVTAYSTLDQPGATLDSVVAALAGGGERAQQAAALLKLGGEGVLKAVDAAFEKLDPAGRRLAADVVTSVGSCSTSAPLLIRAMLDADSEVARKGRAKLENPRCGRLAANALVDSLRQNESGRPRVAPLLAMLAPQVALEPLADVMAEGTAEARAAIRDSFARAAREADKGKLLSLLGDPKRTTDAKIDLLRALSDRTNEFPAEANAAIAALLEGTPSFRTRYLLVEPVAALARAGDDAAAARLSALLTKDPEWPVRAHAAELARGIGKMNEVLTRAARDPEPRVREAALLALGSAAGSVAVERLAADPWTFVREAAVLGLAAAPPSASTDNALGAALGDSSPVIRAGAAAALGARRASSWAGRLRDRLEDDDEDAFVRAASARALGAMCHTSSIDRLTKLARGGASPVATPEEATISAAAVDALGKLHPPDLRDRLAPLLAPEAPPLARRMAEGAMAAPGACRRGR